MRNLPALSVKFLISVILLWFLVHTSKLNFHLLSNLLDTPFMLAFTLIISFTTLVFSTLRWYLLNQAQDIRVSFRFTLLPTYLGIAFNQLLPGGVGGDFYRCFYLFRKIPENKSPIMLSILFDRIMGLAGIFVAICLFSLFHLNDLHFQIIIITSLCICFGILLFLFADRLLPQETGLSLWLNKRYPDKKWSHPLLSLLQGLHIYRHAKLTLVKCMVISLVIQMIIAITCLFIAIMLNFPPISFVDMLLAVGLTQIVNLIPLAPGGFGIGEIAFANILILLNPQTTASYATIFLAYRILSLLPYLPGVLLSGWNTTKTTTAYPGETRENNRLFS